MGFASRRIRATWASPGDRLRVTGEVLSRHGRVDILVNTVGITVDNTGNSPVVIIPNQVSDSDDYGHLYQAPYGVGDVAHAQGSGSVSLKVEVLQKFGSSYNIKIEYRR